MISEKRISQYIRIALSTISADRESKEKIRREMNYDIQNKVFDSGKGDPFEVLGNPASYAREFIEERKSTYTQVRTRFSRTCDIGSHAGYEFISKSTVLGLPFIHINTRPFGVAKGIIAVVNVAIGVLAIGGVSIGLFSLGGVALSLLLSLGGASASLFSAFGGLAIALYLAGGGLAVSFDFAVGGAAIARNYAIGGFSSARVAIGGDARGVVAIYEQNGVGNYLLRLPRTADQIIDFVISKGEEISDVFEWAVRLIY